MTAIEWELLFVAAFCVVTIAAVGAVYVIDAVDETIRRIIP